MDKIERYRQIIRETLTPLMERRYANADVTNEAVFDREHDRYLIMSAGWEGNDRRIHYCLVHLDIINDKVWIQRDNTEDGIGYELEAAGIPKSDIVPAFHPVNVRPHNRLCSRLTKKRFLLSLTALMRQLFRERRSAGTASNCSGNQFFSAVEVSDE